MKLALFLLNIQIGYILAKTINSPPCKNHSESLKISRSNEKLTTTPENIDTNSEDVFERTPVLYVNDRYLGNLPKYNTNFNEMQSRRYLSNNHPDNLSKWPTNLNKIENKKVNLPPVTYQAIDPKNIFVYGLYPPKFNKHGLRNNEANNPKANKTDFNNTDLNKNGDEDTKIKNENNQTNETQSEFRTNNFRTDVTNIRELRQHLLDHLLDYFLNIIMEEKNHNVTRKKNSKDVMKVEKKLRNYYGPQTDILELDDENSDYSDSEYDDNYRRNNNDETEVVFNKNDYVDEKNTTDKESIETQRNETEIDITENDQLLWQPTNKDQVYIDEISNKTIMIPIIEDYDDSLEIVAPVKRKDFGNNDTIIEITEDSNSNLDNITTDKYDVLQEIKPINVSENVTDDYIYANDDEESTEKLFFEDFPDSDDYSSIENDTSASVADKMENNENITVSTADGQPNNERPARRTLNDDSGQNSDEKISKTRKNAAKMSRKHELNEKIVIVTSPDSSEEELAIKVNNKQFKTKNSRKLGKKQKKRGCRKSFVLNLNIKLI